MTLPIKRRINTELFIDRTAALYVLASKIKDENVVRLVYHCHLLIYRSSIPCAKSAKWCGTGRPWGSLFRNEFDGNVKEITSCHKKYREEKEKKQLELTAYYDSMLIKSMKQGGSWCCLKKAKNKLFSPSWMVIEMGLDRIKHTTKFD